MTYTPILKSKQVIIGTGCHIVVTGWTPAKKIAQRLDPCDYAAIGQLYSPTRGLNFLIRNLLANPQYQHILLLDWTREDKNTGGVRRFYDFWLNGFEEGIDDAGQPCWVVRSPHLLKGYIDREVDGDVLEAYRRSIAVALSSNPDGDLHVLLNKLGQYYVRPAIAPATFPLREAKSDLLPGPLYGHRIQGETIAETWVRIIQRIRKTGVPRPCSSGKWQELINLTAIVGGEPEKFYVPDYLPVNQEAIARYLPQILEDNQDVRVKYTYGQRLRSWFGVDQVAQVIEKLTADPDSASAVMSLWDVRDHERGGSPCLNHVWVRIVRGYLTLTALFRSNDMFSAWPSNAFGLRALQRHICNEINGYHGFNLELGPLMTISQSAHIYDDCWEAADNLIQRQYPRLIRQEQQQYADPVGNFIIEWIDGEIVVQQTTPGTGVVVGCYSGRNPLTLLREICQDNPAITPAHAGYLGMELQKAQSAQAVYSQDRLLIA